MSDLGVARSTFVGSVTRFMRVLVDHILGGMIPLSVFYDFILYFCDTHNNQLGTIRSLGLAYELMNGNFMHI